MPRRQTHPLDSARDAALVDPLNEAYVKLILAVIAARPRPLTAHSSPGARHDRICHVEAQLIAVTDWLKALVEDTATHLPLGKRLDDVVQDSMDTLSSHVRGEMVMALESVR